jgi:hypothetical protein
MDESEWAASRTGRFTVRGNCPRYPVDRGLRWAPDPVWTLWSTEKIFPDENRSPAVQPLARRYTDLQLRRYMT